MRAAPPPSPSDRWRRLSTATLLTLWLLPAAAETPATVELEATERALAATREQIGSWLAERRALAALLAEQAQRQASLWRLQAQLAKARERAQRRARTHVGRQAQAGRSVADHREELARALTAMYRAGRNLSLHSLVALDQPATAARVQRYFHHVIDSRAARIGETRQRMASDLAEQSQLDALLGRLNAETAALSQHAALMRRDSGERAATLRAVDGHLLSARLSLGEQAHRRGELAALAAIERRRAAAAERRRNAKLPWPVNGELSARFGQSRGSDASWSGLMIRAPQGREVTAVGDGEVEYAGWLRGYGLMLILNHGGGLMSLYGNNESLMVDVGDAVLSGDAIATVGQSSRLNQVGLYFELRQGGVSVDPLPRLRESAAATQ